jgi:hypothetical protein
MSSCSIVTIRPTYLINVDSIIASVSFDGWITSRKVLDEHLGLFEGARSYCGNLVDYIMHVASNEYRSNQIGDLCGKSIFRTSLDQSRHPTRWPLVTRTATARFTIAPSRNIQRSCQWKLFPSGTREVARWTFQLLEMSVGKFVSTSGWISKIRLD